MDNEYQDEFDFSLFNVKTDGLHIEANTVFDQNVTFNGDVFGLEDLVGQPGPAGAQGYTGSIGYTGSQGAQGATGYNGSRGDLGYTGSQGNQGPTGYNGSIGGLGYTGSKGDLGYTGSQGTTGYNGSRGDLGYTGSIGYTGSTGAGYTGSRGDLGYTGSIGYTGSQGAGYTGSRGDTGYTGSQGNLGYTGSQGAGYTGSQGATGYNGSRGDLGYTGSIGYTGSRGDTGYNGSRGDLGYTGSQGIQGIMGYTGSAGSGGGGGSTAGTTMNIGLFVNAGSVTVPSNIFSVRTTGHGVEGLGDALYAYSSSVNSSYVATYPGSAFVDATGRGFRIAEQLLHVAMFGARGDGSTNDTYAINNAAKEIQRRNGGELHFSPGLYQVGIANASNAYQVGYGAPLMKWHAVTRGLTVRGNGATIRTVSGLKYGSFDPNTGQARGYVSTNGADVASPFAGVFEITNCSGHIDISGFELDGNDAGLVVGGGYGDVGIQIPHCGAYLIDNTGPVRFAQVRAHHFGQDAFQIRTPAGTTNSVRYPLILEQCIGEYNGRQGVSLVGGRGAVFYQCRFSHTGKGRIYSPPGAGVDIEAEGGNFNLEVLFDSCEFVNNSGCGVVGDTGGLSGDITIRRSRMVGTSAYGAWPNEPRWVFEDSIFVGGTTRCYHDGNDINATRFIRCRFYDNPLLSPTGAVFGGPIVDLGAIATNTIFDDCIFKITNNSTLPYTLGGEKYRNVRMSQSSSAACVPYGQYSGQCFIDATGVYTGGISLLYGSLTINGSPFGTGGGGGSATLGAWQAYTPTYGAGTGTLGSGVSTSGRYLKSGTTVFFNAQLTIPSGQLGSAGYYLKLGLPTSVPNELALMGRENALTGKMLAGVVSPGQSEIVFQNFDTSFPGGEGYRLRFMGTYESS